MTPFEVTLERTRARARRLVGVEGRIVGVREEHQLHAESYLSDRLAAGSVARIAGWRATDSSSPDLTVAAPESMLGALGGPRIYLIRRPEDFVVAQQALAGFLRPRARDVDDDEYLDRPGLLAARTVAAGQIRMAHAFGAWAERAMHSELAERFRSRIPRYVELHRSTRRWPSCGAPDRRWWSHSSPRPCSS